MFREAFRTAKMVLVAVANSCRHIVDDRVIETSFNTSTGVLVGATFASKYQKQAATIVLLHAPVTWVAIEPGILLDLSSRGQPV
jgi:hypothetical protein